MTTRASISMGILLLLLIIVSSAAAVADPEASSEIEFCPKGCHRCLVKEASKCVGFFTYFKPEVFIACFVRRILRSSCLVGRA